MTVPDGETEGHCRNVDEVFGTDNDHTIDSADSPEKCGSSRRGQFQVL